MEQAVVGVKVEETPLKGFSPANNSTRIYWKSRKRSAIRQDPNDVEADKTSAKAVRGVEDTPMEEEEKTPPPETTPVSVLSEKRKALFQPLEPINGRRGSNESLFPPPDFDTTVYPKGWLIGKKRKLVNVDVVESMRRIAVQELNRKDREIDGLNEQLEEDGRCLEHLQMQLVQEKSKRAEVERDNAMLQDQISMLMNMLDENDPAAAAAGDEDDLDQDH